MSRGEFFEPTKEELELTKPIIDSILNNSKNTSEIIQNMFNVLSGFSPIKENIDKE